MATTITIEIPDEPGQSRLEVRRGDLALMLLFEYSGLDFLAQPISEALMRLDRVEANPPIDIKTEEPKPAPKAAVKPVGQVKPLPIENAGSQYDVERIYDVEHGTGRFQDWLEAALYKLGAVRYEQEDELFGKLVCRTDGYMVGVAERWVDERRGLVEVVTNSSSVTVPVHKLVRVDALKKHTVSPKSESAPEIPVEQIAMF